MLFGGHWSGLSWGCLMALRSVRFSFLVGSGVARSRLLGLAPGGRFAHGPRRVLVVAARPAVRRVGFARFLAAWHCRPGSRLAPLAAWPLAPWFAAAPRAAAPGPSRRAGRGRGGGWGALAPRVRRARAPGPAARSGVGARVRARLGPRPAVGLSCSPLFCCLLGGPPWSLSRPVPPLSSPSRVGRCRRSSSAPVALVRLGCLSPVSSPCRRPRPSPAAPPSGRVARSPSALARVAPPASGRFRARSPGLLPRPRWRGSPAGGRWWRPRPVRYSGTRRLAPRRPSGRGGVAVACSSACFPRCRSCPPSSPAGAPVPLVRSAPVTRWFAPCPLCGALGLVLSASGAARPFLWCAWCGVAVPRAGPAALGIVAGPRRGAALSLLAQVFPHLEPPADLAGIPSEILSSNSNLPLILS